MLFGWKADTFVFFSLWLDIKIEILCCFVFGCIHISDVIHISKQCFSKMKENFFFLKQGIKRCKITQHISSGNCLNLISSLCLRVLQKGFAVAIIFYFLFFTSNVDGLAKIVFIFLFYCCCRRVWLISDLLAWQVAISRVWSLACVSMTCH